MGIENKSFLEEIDLSLEESLRTRSQIRQGKLTKHLVASPQTHCNKSKEGVFLCISQLVFIFFY